MVQKTKIDQEMGGITRGKREGKHGSKDLKIDQEMGEITRGKREGDAGLKILGRGHI